MENRKSLLSIAKYIQLLKEQLSAYDVSIVGEVTSVSTAASGHVYFTLKDKEENAVLECVIWRSRYAFYGLKIEIGMELAATGHPTIFSSSGNLKFDANSIELVGEGALKKAYDALKKKLTAEGIFASERKRTLPTFPRKIGVITSKQGAVIHDFMFNLGRHGFEIKLIDSRVEGLEALPDLYQALKTLESKDLDVIVLMRGGGSLQSRAAFDSEVLIREVASSPIPIITAIGHHQDVPLCAIAADVTVSTPTAAANLLNTSWDKAAQSLESNIRSIMFGYKEIISDVNRTIELNKKTIIGGYRQIMNNINQAIEQKRKEIIGRFRHIFDSFSYVSSHVPKFVMQISRSFELMSKELSKYTHDILRNVETTIAESDLEVNTMGSKIFHSFSITIGNVTEKISIKEQLISINNPMRQLSLGYSLIQRSEQRLVKSIKDVTIGEEVSIITQDGVIGSQVKTIKEKKYDQTN